MDGLLSLLTSGSFILGYIVPFLFVLTIVVFVHEMGHFLVARWCGVDVDAFSIGFGPEITGFNDRVGTRWKLCWIPLGGYVKFRGDEGPASMPDHEAAEAATDAERAGMFQNKPLAARAAIVAAGPIANFILAIAIFAVVFMSVGRSVTPAIVDDIQADSAAETAGMLVGDQIVVIDGKPIDSFNEVQRIVSVSAGRELEIVVLRDGTEIGLVATPDLREIEDNFGYTHRIGLLGVTRAATPEQVERIVYGPPGALWLGVRETGFIIERTMVFIYEIIVGRQSADQLGGPIRIAQVSGDVAAISFLALINLTAVLSISIGLLNLFPIPMLDGGHLVFYALEALRGRPLSERTLEISFRIGLALVLMLMLFATWNDLVHLNLL